jgi:protein gp37
MSKIEWTQSTLNILTGCTQISPGCAHCYAKRMTTRMMSLHPEKYANGFNLTLHPEELAKPARMKAGRMFFLNSMSDTFHEDVPEEFIGRTFEMMADCPQHLFQGLTKRSERLLQLAPALEWARNIWQGVTVESQNYVHRIDHLRATPAAVRFLSLEPLLGPLPNINLADIHWVIVGGESGPGARPMQIDWVRDLRDQCVQAGVKFFFKQWGGTNKKKTGSQLDGRVWKEMPTHHLSGRTKNKKK